MSAPPAKPGRPELALERILAALEAGLIAATDDEIMQAAKDLGMNPAMKGSAAYADIRILLASRQVRADDRVPPAPEKKNGTPSAHPSQARSAALAVKRPGTPHPRGGR